MGKKVKLPRSERVRLKRATDFRGRFGQTGIYLGKMVRMFLYQNDWKVLPMAAIIAGLVMFAVGTNLFRTQEGTLQGCFALSCVCVWNGLFNSIQSVCRERSIVKREHRAGLYISAYVFAHMIYQLFLCALQSAIIIGICIISGVEFPGEGLVTKLFIVDFALTLLFATYAADMLALAISSLVRTTTAAMTVMPFVLIFQLLFSGGLVQLEGPAEKLTDITITRWSLSGLCALGHYNEQPMVTLWNTIFKFREFEMDGVKPIEAITEYMQRENLVDEFELQSAAYVQNSDYASTVSNLLGCWGHLILIALISAFVAMLLLEMIDKDQR